MPETTDAEVIFEDVATRVGFINVSFQNTATKVEIIKWYTIMGAPATKQDDTGEVMLVPKMARFTFTEGAPSGVFLAGWKILKDGSVSDQEEQFNNLWIWNRSEWPAWLCALYDQARAEFLAESKK